MNSEAERRLRDAGWTRNPGTVNLANQQLGIRVVQDCSANTGARITSPQIRLATQLPYGLYTVTVRTVFPPSGAGASEFSCRARITWGSSGGRDSVEVDTFPFAVVPFLGDGITVALGNDNPSIGSGGHGRAVEAEETVEIVVSPGYQPWQATRSFMLPSPLAFPSTTFFDVVPYAMHVRLWASTANYNGNRSLNQLDRTGTVISSVLGGSLPAANEGAGVRLSQACQRVRVNSSVDNLIAAVLSFQVGGSAGRS